MAATLATPPSYACKASPTPQQLHLFRQNYLAVGGTVKGTNVAPNYAINFMNSFEKEHVYTLVWKRYIDDIFVFTFFK